KLHRRADETLQQRVVQFSCDARSLRKTLFEPDIELLRQLPQAKTIQSRCDGDANEGRSRLERTRLPEHRPDLERQRRLRTVPQTIAVRGHDAKSIVAVAQIRVRGLT